MPSLHTDQVKSIQANRRRQAYEMRMLGMSYPQIADKLGVSSETIRRDIKAWTDNIPREKAEELRNMELDKLNQLELQLQKRLRTGSPQAVNAAIRVMQHRATLMGLDRIESHDGVDTAKGMMQGIIDALMQGKTATPADDEEAGD